MDEPKGNEEKRARNLEKMLARQEANEEYARQNDANGGATRVGKRGSEVKRTPSKPQYEVVLISGIVCRCGTLVLRIPIIRVAFVL